MTKRRRFSSNQVVNALLRAGFTVSRTRGSHCVLEKPRESGGYITCVVVVSRRELKDPTLDGILDQAEMTYDRFLQFAKVRRKHQ